MDDLSSAPHEEYTESMPWLGSRTSQQFKLSYLKNISVINKFIAHNLIINPNVDYTSGEENVVYCFQINLYCNNKSPSIPNGTQNIVLHFSN